MIPFPFADENSVWSIHFAVEIDTDESPRWLAPNLKPLLPMSGLYYSLCDFAGQKVGEFDGQEEGSEKMGKVFCPDSRASLQRFVFLKKY